VANQSLRKALVQIGIFVAVIVVISLIAIWFNLGAVAHSETMLSF